MLHNLHVTWNCDADSITRHDTHPQFDPLIQQPSVVKFAQQPWLCDGIRRIAHIAPAAGNITEIIVSLLAQDGRPTH